VHADPDGVCGHLVARSREAAALGTGKDGPMVTHATHMVGTLPDRLDRPGGPIHAVTLRCPTLEIEVWSIGATLVEAVALGPAGQRTPLVARLPDLPTYDDPQHNHFVGSTMGRWCRMLDGAQLVVDGRTHALRTDERGRHAHGGPAGLHTQVWEPTVQSTATEGSVVLRHVSPEGHQGYPGRVEVEVEYLLTESGELTVTYTGRTSATTVLGLANHVYWRIGAAAIDELELRVPATERLAITDDVVAPDPVTVTGGPDDLSQRGRVGSRALDDFYLVAAGDVCELRDPLTGLTLALSSTATGAGVYTGDFDPVPRRGICLEFGGWPGATTRPDFPNPLLHPGEEYLEAWTLRVSSP